VKFDLEAHNWRILRGLLRAKNKGLTGAELRKLWWSRRSKSGRFLDELVKLNLIQAVKVCDCTSTLPSEVRKPVQMRTVYTITDAGKVAAEYGEFEKPFPVPALSPVVANGKVKKSK